MWFKIKSYSNQNLLISSSPFSSTLCMLFYDDFHIFILCFIKICIVLSVIILKYVVTSHFHCLCYPFSVQKFFSPSLCLFQQYVYLFCSYIRGNFLSRHLSSSISVSRSPVQFQLLIVQQCIYKFPPPHPPFVLYDKGIWIKEKQNVIHSFQLLSSVHCNCIVWVTPSLDKVHIEGEACQGILFWQGFRSNVTILQWIGPETYLSDIC
jgi:hypothetical protein